MAKLPEGRKPLDPEWFGKQIYSLDREIQRMNKSRKFMENTCPASRHVQMMAEDLAKVGKYPMLQEDPKHCAGSIASVVNSLYSARSFLQSLGYTWEIDSNGNVNWVKEETKDKD
jgi:hypothetical protein